MNDPEARRRRGIGYGLAAYGLWGAAPLFWPLVKSASALELLAHRVIWSLIICAILLLTVVPRGWWDVPKSVALVVLFLPSIQFLFALFALEPIGLLMLLPLIRAVWPLWARHAPTIEIRQRRDRIGLRVGQAALLIPCLLGLVLMAQAIGRLSM